MAYRHTTGGDLSSRGDFLDMEGTYHMLITEVHEEPTDKNGNLINNAAFKVVMSVLAGTVPGQEDKIHNQIFFNSKLDDSEEQRDRNKKAFDKFFVATCILTAEQAQDKGKAYDIDLNALAGRQLFVKLTKREGDEFMKAWDNFYHVDDPAMKAMPKNLEMISTLPKEQRAIGSQPAKGSARNGGGSAAKNPAQSSGGAGSGGAAPAHLSDEEIESL